MGQYIKYLVCYDVSSNKKRKELADQLKDLGLVPIQKSVFYGDLKPPEAKSLKSIVSSILDETDSCLWFPCQLETATIHSCFGLEDFKYDPSDGHRIL